MSIHVLSWVLKKSEAKLGARLVLIVLADHAKEDGSMAWPAVETIAEQARMSRRAVQDALRKLEAEGAIRPRGRSQSGTVIYDVLMGGADSARGADDNGAGAQNSSQGGEAASPEPSVNRQENRKKKSISPAEEVDGFEAWMGHHVTVAASFGLSMSVPKAETLARTELHRRFAALLEEGYSPDEIMLASEGILSSEWHRAEGHVKLFTVMRQAEKLQDRIDAGRAWRAAAGSRPADKYGHLDG